MMTAHTIHEAKTHLSRLVARAEAGEEIVLMRGKTPVARIVPLKAAEAAPKKARELGWLKGEVWLDERFDEPFSEDELKAWGLAD
jgi:prevent-host-death family protein